MNAVRCTHVWIGDWEHIGILFEGERGAVRVVAADFYHVRVVTPGRRDRLRQMLTREGRPYPVKRAARKLLARSRREGFTISKEARALLRSAIQP